MTRHIASLATAVALISSVATSYAAPAAQREELGRGAIALQATSSRVVISWRSIEADDPAMTFDILCNGEKVNPSPIVGATHYTVPSATVDQDFVIQAVSGGKVVETFKPIVKAGDVYHRIHTQLPPAGSVNGSDYTYTPNDCSVGDVDGDGEYEIFLKWQPSNQKDNSEYGYTGNTLIDCYRLDGTRLWRIDLGRNIRSGAHYTQFLVYDFDGDGRAELACKTAPGTIDGTGKNVLMGNDDPKADYRNSRGIVKTGPEYLTVFNGLTGAEITTTSYVPLRSVQSDSSWGDSYGNRSERYLACVAYLDGVKPSIVMCRGYYTHSYLCAWDFDGKKLTQRWLHASTTKGQGAYGEGAHALSVGDLDGDGFDEIVYGSAAIDHDGKLLHRTGAGHGDALHLGDFDPDHEGLEIFMVHEEKGSGYKYDATFRDAATGRMLWSIPQSGNDIGRGMCADVSASNRGHEAWPGSYYGSGAKGNATFDAKGKQISEKRGSTCFRLYWDGDVQDELFDGCFNSSDNLAYPVITKVNDNCTGSSTLLDFTKYHAQTCNTTKATPCLSADILGDWREELIMWDAENPADLLIFSTVTSTNLRVPCLMEDHNYRMAVAWQNVAYNQPPHLGYALAERFDVNPAIVINEGAIEQTIELGSSIRPIKGSWKNMKGISISGAKNGLASFVDDAARTWEVSGTPTALGTYNIYVMSVGASTQLSTKIVIKVVEPAQIEKVADIPFETIGETTPNLLGNDPRAEGAPQLVAGRVGNAAYFNGSTDRFIMDAYDAVQLGQRDFTIMFWFKSTDTAGYLFHKGSIKNDGQTTTGNWIGVELKNGNLTFAIDDDVTKSTAVAPGTEYFDGGWHHLACVRSGVEGKLRMYIDKQLVAEGADNTGAINDNNEPLVIGNVTVNYDCPYEGAIDEFSISTGAYSHERISQAYDNSSVLDIEADAPAGAIRLYNAVSGQLIYEDLTARAEAATSSAAALRALLPATIAPGVYILIVDTPAGARHYKITL